MRPALAEIIRCPFCGGRLSLADELFHRRDRDGALRDGILGCHCCTFPVVDGIPVLHLQPPATAARDDVQAGRPEHALRGLMAVGDDSRGARFEAAAANPSATYREMIDAIGPPLEGTYFLYRFSDPTFLVADAVVRAVAARALTGGARAIDLCGGSGHLTRTLGATASHPPVLADLHYFKIWLARRFVSPYCDPVCCDANGPLPFARGAFGLAQCTDALMFLWTKRALVGEMHRLLRDDGQGVVVIGHAHNESVWSPSHGQALSPAAYADLFETAPVRIFGESTLLADVLAGGPLDLSRRQSDAALEHEPALTLIATRRADVFSPHPLAPRTVATGVFSLNPLYAVERAGPRLRLVLRWPSPHYADEFEACRRYLPDEVVVDPALLEGLPTAEWSEDRAELIRRHVILDLPPRYA